MALYLGLIILLVFCSDQAQEASADSDFAGAEALSVHSDIWDLFCSEKSLPLFQVVECKKKQI